MNSTLINKVRSSRLLTEKTIHFNEYVDELRNFQNDLTDIAFEKEEGEFIRLDDMIVRLQNDARSKGLSNDPVFFRGINSLRTVDRELKICLSGKAGEDRVSRSPETGEDSAPVSCRRS